MVKLHFSGHLSHSGTVIPVEASLEMDRAQLLAILATLAPDPPAAAETPAALIETSPRLNPRAANWDWLTPEMVVSYFQSRPMLRAHADDVADVVRALAYGAPPAAALPALAGPPDQLNQDLARVLAGGEEGLWKPDGSLNQSEIGRRIGIKNSGISNRERILAVEEVLLSSSAGGRDASSAAGSSQAA